MGTSSFIGLVLRAVGAAAVTIAVSLVFALVIIEWLAGCGESYVDAQGERHYYECVFITFPKEQSQ